MRTNECYRLLIYLHGSPINIVAHEKNIQSRRYRRRRTSIEKQYFCIFIQFQCLFSHIAAIVSDALLHKNAIININLSTLGVDSAGMASVWFHRVIVDRSQKTCIKIVASTKIYIFVIC